MTPGLLDSIVNGGALAILALVLFWVFRSQHDTNARLLEMIDAQLEHIKASTQVQQQLCDEIGTHEDRAGDRHRELLSAQTSAHTRLKKAVA